MVVIHAHRLPFKNNAWLPAWFEPGCSSRNSFRVVCPNCFPLRQRNNLIAAQIELESGAYELRIVEAGDFASWLSRPR